MGLVVAQTVILPVEISFLLRHGVSRAILEEAIRLGLREGVAPQDALLRHGLVGEELFYRTLAKELNTPYAATPGHVAVNQHWSQALHAGLAPFSNKRGFLIAPSGETLRRLLARRKLARAFAEGMVLTTPTRLRDTVLRSAAGEIAHEASHSLAENQPERSFRDGISRRQKGAFLLCLLLLAMSFLLAPKPSLILTGTLLSCLFLILISVRLAAMLEPVLIRPRFTLPFIPEAHLPVYTLIVPLFRETGVLDRLIQALDALDYPKSRLDIKLVIEEEDEALHQALAGRALPARYEVIIAPEGQPRTKPRALNIALPLARGAYVVIFDAEDIPDPGQLRMAVNWFTRLPQEVACLQARLVIDNTHDSWLTRFFTLEYACLFDVLNPGLAAAHLPIPLGGTSNHFRIEALRALQGWDAWNVTEDADLGIRVALAGCRIVDLPSSTYEEAPAKLGSWMRQRSRWLKGYMQTCLTHSRRPLVSLRRLGLSGWIAAVTLTFGTVMAALLYPFLQILAVWIFWQGDLFTSEDRLDQIAAALGVTLFVAGWISLLLPPLVAMHRRGLWSLWPHALLLWLYYGLVSLAAWRALFELLFQPYHWHKTEHGLVLTSRTGALLTAPPEFLPCEALPAMPFSVPAEITGARSA
jgi:glycosyltransferase XagB